MTPSHPAGPRARPVHGRAWRWVVDVALGLAIGWLLIVATWMGQQQVGQEHMGRPHLGDRLVVGRWMRASALLVGAAVAVARLYPRTAWVVGLLGVAAYLGQGGAPAAGVVAAIALGRALLVSSRRWPWLLALLPAYGAAALADEADTGTFFSVPTMIVWTVLPLVGMAAGRARGEQRRVERARELDRVARSERLRLARDIHDVVGHSLSLISLQSGVALKVLDTDPDQARRSLEAIRATSKQALTEVRTTLGVFRDEGAFRDEGGLGETDEAPLAPTPGLVAVRQMVEQAASSGVKVTLTSDVDPDAGPASIQSVAHRVVQEGLTNAIRHAPGASVRVEMRVEGPWLRVMVADSGPEVTTVEPGNGLTGMRERVEAISGHLRLASGVSGFVVEALLPWGPTAGADAGGGL